MKKFIFSLLFVSMSIISFNASALFGIKISFEKGTREWNADRTEVQCVGRGICKFSIEFNTGTAGVLGFDDQGRFCLSTSRSILNDSHWSDTFTNGTVTIHKDIPLDSGITSKISNCPGAIKAGSYPYTIQGESLVVYFR